MLAFHSPSATRYAIAMIPILQKDYFLCLIQFFERDFIHVFRVVDNYRSLKAIGTFEADIWYMNPKGSEQLDTLNNRRQRIIQHDSSHYTYVHANSVSLYS